MRSADYWAERMELLNEAQLAKGEAYVQKMKREYDKAMSSIQKDIDVFYHRFAKNNSVDLVTARQMLKAGELKELKWSLEDYIKAGRENAIDQRWMKELENASIRVRMSRLEALQIQMRQQVELLTAKRQTGATSLLGDIYKDSYYRNIFELQKGIGIGASFAKLNSRQIESLLVTPWAPDGSNFSQRIWGDRSKLILELQTTLTQGLIRGDSSNLMISRLSERMGVSRTRAETLILTESAYFSGASRRASYVELNVEKYRIVATLDKRTSDICRTMDGSIFLVSEAQAGLNCAPFHARCRTVDIPYYEDNVKERAARDDGGKTYDVPGDMTYPEWEKKYVTGEIEKPAGEGFNRRYNPKASFHVDLPATPETVLDEIADVNRSIARQGFKEGKEIMVIMDKAGEVIGRASGELNKVAFTQEIHEKLLKAPNSMVTLTHNHPRGTRINVKDIRNFSLYPSLLNIIAVGHDGGVSFVSTQGILVSAMVFQDVMMNQGAKVTASLQNNKEYAMMAATAQREYFDFLLLQSIIQELGWVYGEEFGSAKTDRRF
jgi:SPP1 gp7 family putative phage head morphogenesis protein